MDSEFGLVQFQPAENGCEREITSGYIAHFQESAYFVGVVYGDVFEWNHSMMAEKHHKVRNCFEMIMRQFENCFSSKTIEKRREIDEKEIQVVLKEILTASEADFE